MSAAACPICQNPSAVEYRPFCSRRCADVDLHRWLTGRYVLDEDAEGDDAVGLIADEDDG